MATRTRSIGGNLILSSFLAALSYLPFEMIAKFTLVFCVAIFVFDPFPTSRLVSVGGECHLCSPHIPPSLFFSIVCVSIDRITRGILHQSLIFSTEGVSVVLFITRLRKRCAIEQTPSSQQEVVNDDRKDTTEWIGEFNTYTAVKQSTSPWRCFMVSSW